MNDAQLIRTFMPTRHSQIKEGTIDQLYGAVVTLCCAEARTGKYVCWWDTEKNITPEQLIYIDPVILRLRNQGFDIPHREREDEHMALINWRHPTAQTCDARRMQYLTASFTDHPKHDAARLLYNEVMIKCREAATDYASGVVFSPQDLLDTEHQASLLLGGWEVMVARLKAEGFEVVHTDVPLCDITIKW